MEEKVKSAIAWLTGTSSPYAALAVTSQAEIEFWTRMSVILVGIIPTIIASVWLHKINKAKYEQIKQKDGK